MKTQTQKQPITHCLMCKRALTNAESITRGIGPECAEKLASALSACGVSGEEMSVWEAAGEQPARWAGLVLKAIAAGRLRDARSFADAARRATPFLKDAPFAAEPILIRWVNCGQLSGDYCGSIMI